MKFDKLRLVGFKSFVEPTDFEIRPGLTGIVGPNGCGKSNLLESLRWVMGATSAKALRGAGMDAVIFSGTSNRPARNWAEVMLTLDNQDRTLPAEFNEHETLEVTRRITRKEEGSDSTYKINGKTVRARDVQLLFADASTGANSPALVRQGQISELINAKPQNRRRLLEEAAGITGLYTRRHEAELRLRAAETNLERLDDVTGELEGQRHALAKQARQASRYRNLSGHIRRTEALSAYLRWEEANSALKESEKALAEVNQLLEETARAAASTSSAQSKAHEILEPLRLKEAEAAAALHRLTVEQENIEAEADRAVLEADRLENEVERLKRDIIRETELGQDAETALETLQAEEQGLRSREAAETDRLAEAQARMQETTDTLQAAEADFDRRNTEAAEQDAERRALTAGLQEAQGRLERIIRDLSRMAEERAGLLLSAEEEAKLSAAKEAMASAVEAQEVCEQNTHRAEEQRRSLTEQEKALRQPMQKAEQSLGELKAEADALTRLLQAGTNEDYPALIEEVTVSAGYENALAAALGDDLGAALAEEAPAHWSSLGEQEITSAELPAGTEPLSEFVKAPAALLRRLRSIGVVDASIGNTLQSQLSPGQRLVSPEGDLWRWDGYVAKAEAKTAAAIRLEQRNRLETLHLDISSATHRLEQATADHERAEATLRDAVTADRTARDTLREAQSAKQAAQAYLVELERHHERANTRLAGLEENISRLTEEKSDAQGRTSTAEASLAALPDTNALRDALSLARDALTNERATASEARAAYNDLARESEIRATRLEEIARERGVWSTRGTTARTRIEEVTKRLADTEAAQEKAIGIPQAIEEKRLALFEQIEVAESRRRAAADALAEAMENTSAADKALKAAEAEAIAAREARARIEAQVEAARERVSDATEIARETCSAAPEDLLKIAEHDPETLPERASIDAKLEKYKRERENLGGVNLRADEEMAEIDERLEEMTTEREDCEAAIRKLRHSIGNLNREGRVRLLEAFETVNANFQKLFVELFGGGSSELKLVDSEDPLEAGLEIFASPPGKKLTSMTLMSGGEQALTATALIFAVFMSNPAPVCVLDEVDAPLDDVNTDRFCAMLHKMAAETETRFIVITHHALTMSRMDRLYGVTMIERGVSQLVSVDLTSAEQLVAAE